MTCLTPLLRRRNSVGALTHWFPGTRSDMVNGFVDDAVNSLRFVNTVLPGRVGAAYLKTLTNGWCTPTRFGSTEPCYLCGQHSGSFSTIIVCRLSWTYGMSLLRKSRAYLVSSCAIAHRTWKLKSMRRVVAASAPRMTQTAMVERVPFCFPAPPGRSCFSFL